MKQKNDEEHFEEEFIKLVSENKLSINSIEELMLEEIKRYKNKLEMQLEELLKSQINEKELITKKNENGKKKGYELKNKRKIEFILVTGKISIYRTVLQIVGDIELKKYNLRSKLIVPLDEYLGIDKLPFKVSIRAMIEISFWGQNQPSFQRASEIIKRSRQH